MGKFPQEKKGSNLELLKRQIEWITKLEVNLNEIIGLGEESDQLDRDAFSSNNVLTVLDYFPFSLQEDLVDYLAPAEDDGKEKLKLIVKSLKKLRKKRQEFQKTAELRVSTKSGENKSDAQR